MADLIIGMGEIGKAVKEAVTAEAQVYDLNQKNHKISGKDVDVMHICFPYSEKFVASVQDYIAKFQPHHLIVWSTVPIGTTKQIAEWAVHSPVESKHPDLTLGIRHMERWIGYNDEVEGKFFNGYFIVRGLKTKLVSATRFTEALKLLSTTEYGINIVFADYKKRIADDLDMPYELTKEWNLEYNKLYKNLGYEKQFQKFVLDPPNGKIGGHCIRENSILLNQQYPDPWVERIGDMK